MLSLLFLGAYTYCLAQDPELPDQTLSPYFFVKSKNPDIDQMPLKGTSAKVNIAGVIADVVVKQVYVNEGKETFQLQETTRTLMIQESGTYKVTVTSENGCAYTAVFEVAEECDHRFFIPTAFSPNGDGVNDEFRVFGNDFNQFSIQILNRWGEVVYYSRNHLETWDGSYRGQPVTSGSYVVITEYKPLPNGEKKMVKTKLAVIR